MFDYLRKKDDARIRFRTRIPENELIFKDPNVTGCITYMEKHEVELVEGLPVPKGKDCTNIIY